MSSLIQIRQKLDLDSLRAKLAGASGPWFWSSLEEIAATDDFRRLVEDEFPERAPDWNDPSKRRTFLKLMGASLALAGLSACTKQPKEAIVPYVRQPEEFVPGRALFYATAMPTPSGALGVLVESHLGRPTKIEGNPNHPASLGATDVFAQASILDLYDPDRSQSVLRNGQISSWTNFTAALIRARDEHAARQGAGIRLLTRPIVSPSLHAHIRQLLTAMPQARWHQWDPSRSTLPNAVHHIAGANILVSLDADFLHCGGASTRLAHDFAEKRRLLKDRPAAMNRLYVVESTVTTTGAAADHRLRLRPSEIVPFAAGLARALGVSGVAATGPAHQSIPAIVKDLQANRGASLVLAGDYQPPALHAIAQSVNQALGNVGKTVDYRPPIEAEPVDGLESLRQLVNDINAGQVDMLLVLGCNPVYDAPADFAFADALKKIKLRAHLGLYNDETGWLSHWHVPQAHYLESWGDTRAYDGTATIQQPLIRPLFGGKTIHEVLDILLNNAERSVRDIVQEHWRSQARAANFDAWWQQALHDGVVPEAALTSAPPQPLAAVPVQPSPATGQLEIIFRPDPAVWDGSFSNNAWLQEMPKPQNKMTWDNAAWISPATAQRLGIATADQVDVAFKGRAVRAPVWVMPGHADDCVTLHFGYGRTHCGHNADGIGFNAYALRASDVMWHGSGVELRKTGARYPFAVTQHTRTMEERDPVRLKTLGEYTQHPEVHREAPPAGLTMYPPWPYEGYKWGMSIDLNACTGCQACTVACQAENNIPVVGKDQVSRGRHMNWLRVDRYFHGKLDDPELYFQPVPCMHCETAPCELVCPVAATVHSGDGLNQMIYNRCVGTRYCSNNCPYKVRRFNFYLYSDWYSQSLYGLRNPDVTVRSRGVMEKCTYCVQRIQRAKIESEKEDRRIRDGEVVPACAQACPTKAIVFGDMNDPNSLIARFKAQPRDYGLLEDLNTRPRTTYLARVRNPNPELERG